MAPSTSQSAARTQDSGANLARTIMDQWHLGSSELESLRQDHWINQCYLVGDQWIGWNAQRNAPYQLPQGFSPLGRGRECVKRNLMGANEEIIMSRYTSTGLGFEVPPSETPDDVIRGAQLSTQVINHTCEAQNWDAVRREVLLNSRLSGTAALMVEWDPTAGKSLDYRADTDLVVATGEPFVKALSINDFCIEPGNAQAASARWWIHRTTMPAGMAKERFRLNFDPAADGGALMTAYQRQVSDTAQRRNSPNGKSDEELARTLTTVYTLYERPHARKPKGAYTVIVGGRLAYSGPWPFPTTGAFKGALNLEVIRQRPTISGKWYGSTVLNDVRELQREYNTHRSKIAQLSRNVALAKMAVAAGSQVAEESITNNEGEYFVYQPDGFSQPPHFIAPPQVGRWYTQESADLAREINILQGAADVDRGMTDIDRASGQALAYLGEKSAAPSLPAGVELNRAWGRIASMVLELYGSNAIEMRQMEGAGPRGIPQIGKWNGAMLKGQTKAVVPKHIAHPQTRAERMAHAQFMLQNRIISDPRIVAKLLDVGQEGFDNLLDADAASATLENAWMGVGYAMMVEKFDNHAIHIAEHNSFRKSAAYRFGTQAMRKLVDDHIAFHEMIAHEEAAAQMQREMVMPGLSQIPQANEPLGAALPDLAARRGMAAQAAPNQGSQPAQQQFQGVALP